MTRSDTPLLRGLFIYIRTREWVTSDSFLTHRAPDRPIGISSEPSQMFRAKYFRLRHDRTPDPPPFRHKTTTNMIALRSRGRPRRHAATASSFSTTTTTEQVLTQPDERAMDSNLEQIVLGIAQEYRPDSTSAIYDAKSNEYFGYCTSLYPNDPYAKVLSQYKVYRFMFYQCFRDQKKRGGSRETRASGNNFVRANYDEVMAKYMAFLTSHDGSAPPEPAKPVGKQTIDQYKAVLLWVYKTQTARRVLSLVWDQIWTLPCEQLHKVVKERRSAMKKLNYEEKLEAEFAPYTAVMQYDQIEEDLWKRGDTNIRSACAWLRHRFCLLYTTSGILRCESLYRAELSDFLGLDMKKPEDVHPLYLMISQIPQGKFLSKNRASYIFDFGESK